MDKSKLPDQLPYHPQGWTKSMVLHMKFADGGVASYEVRNAEGELMPIVFSYDTRKKTAGRGFSLPGVEGMMTWQQLRKEWPQWLEKP